MTHADSLSGLQARRAALEVLLTDHQDIWRSAPFHVLRPEWGERHPEFVAHLLAMPDEQVATLASDNRALIDLASRFVPALRALHELIDLPRLDRRLAEPDAQGTRHVPGRKQAQIEAFAGCVGEVVAPVLEWCAGKGHLGRLLAGHGRHPVLSLELDYTLCEAGGRLAARAGAAQTFTRTDALSADASACLAGRHALALHACGDLHLALLRGVVARAAPALDLAPCCYYRIATREYVPLNPDAGLKLSRDELHLAVTETATAGSRERRQRDRAMAWKLAFLEWRAEQGTPRERTFKPVPAAWYALGFSAWMERLALREGIAAPDPWDPEEWEAKGWARQRGVSRLDLARLAFRRPLEIWLVLDRALFLARHGYRVFLAEFCERALTPRNLLIQARIERPSG